MFKHPITKSDLVLKDLETIKRINEIYTPRPSARLKAMRVLADNGIQTGGTMMPGAFQKSE